MTQSTINPPKVLLADLQTEQTTLNRVSHRLAMTDPGPALEKVLSLLLPRLLSRIGKNDDARKKHKMDRQLCLLGSSAANNNNNNNSSNKRKLSGETITTSSSSSSSISEIAVYDQIDTMHDTIHKKLIEMLTHTMKRVREDRSCKLPCGAVLELLTSTTSQQKQSQSSDDDKNDAAVTNAFTINLSLAFLTLGLNRCDPAECASLLPGLLQFWASILDPTNNNNGDSSIGVLHFMDPSRKMRHDQTWHLIFRCLESISHNPMENAAAARKRRAGNASLSSSSSSNNDVTSSSDNTTSETSSASISSLLNKTKQTIAQSSLISAALFDLFADIFLYTPIKNTSSTTVTPGLSPIGYQRLVSGAASQKKTGVKNFREEFVTRMSLRELKLKLLDLIAPCRRFALFLSEKQPSSVVVDDDGNNDDDESAVNDVVVGDEMGISRTVALMVLLTGDPDPDVKSKAESYLRAHMDSYRGKDIVGESSIHDVLLGNSIALAQSIMSFSIGDISSANSKRRVKAKYQDGVVLTMLQSSLGLTYHYDASNDAEQKIYLSVCRAKVPDYTATPALKFVAKMLEDNPKLFQVGIDMGLEEADAAAVYVGTLALAVFSDLRRPGSSSSSVLESAASLLHALCVRLTLFYDARTGSGRDRLRVLLAQSLKLASDVLAPTSAGELTSTGTNVAKTAIGVEIRDNCYGLISTLARSNFALDERQEIFDCGNSSSSSKAFTSIASATLLFGCSSNETEILRPRATSALDALLGGYTRVIALLVEKAKKDMLAEELSAKNNVSVNPWADLSTNGSGSVSVETKGNKDITASLARSLSPLIWNAARRSQPKSSRLAAARWSHELLSHIDAPNAYHLLCFLSGDDDATVSMIAKQAMGVDKTMGEDMILSSWTKDDSNIPSFGEIMTSVVRSKSRPKFKEFHLRAQAASLRFMVQSLFSEESFYGDDFGGDELCTFVSVILETLSSYKGRSLSREETDLVDECSICLSACTSSSTEGRSLVRNFNDDVGFGFNDISMQALRSHSAKARRHFSEVMGHLYEDRTLWTDSPSSFAVSDWIDVTGLMKMANLCKTKLHTMFEPSILLGEVHGAAFLGSQCVRALRLAEAGKGQDVEDGTSDCWAVCADIVSLLGKGLMHSDAAIGNACSRAIVIAFSYEGQDAPNLNKKLFDAVAVALDKMNASLKKFASIDHADANRAESLIQASGLLLAASTSGAGSSNASEKDGTVGLGGARLQLVDSLFGILGSAVYKKDDELSLAVGEALVKYADAFGQGEWSSTGSGAEWPKGPYDAEFAFSLPPHVHILYTLFERELKSSNPMKKNSCAPVMLAIVGHASRLLCNIDTIFSQRAMIQEVIKFMVRFQNNFIHLLSHPKATQLTRECCCRGIAALRGLSTAISIPATETESLNSRLLKAFGETSNYGGSAMIETEAQARERRDGEASNFDATTSAEVGGTSGLSEAALGAYREMASAAVSCDRPDVLYSLMMLSTSHEIWSRHEVRDLYCSKSILGKNGANDTEEIRIALRPHLGELIPRLLRACNDPNKQTREQMSNLWTALTGGGAESRALISQHFLKTMDILIEEAGSKLWRARVGACGALAEIIVGRSWGELGGGGVDIDDEGTGMKGVTASIRLLRLWRITMRALDDVRTPVRERGDTLGRGVRALTIRLCDPKAVENTKEEEEVYLSNAERKRREKESEITSEYAATVSLGWLVKYGLNQPCAEATGICISCLLGIVDVAKPTTLQPVLAELIGSLLMAMSGLEPSALNYLQVRAAGNESSQGATGGYDRLERLRIQLASSGPIAEALNKCLDMVKFVELDAQKKLIPELDSALRKGAGFATRASTADAVTALCNTCPAAFKFPGSSNTNPTVRLLRAIYFASEKERGSTAKDKMTHALGSISMIAPAKAVRILAVKACERYCEASGSNNNPSLRRAAAATVRAIVVRASNHLKDGGPRDVWRKKVLPIAFLGRKDEDAKVAALWNEVWDEGGTAVGLSGDDTFGVLLQEQLLPYLANAILSALRSPSWSNRREACAVVIELVEANVLSPAPRSTTQNLVEERFKQRMKVSSILLNECVKIIRRSRIWDGKGDVCSAASQIAAKWTGVAPMNEAASNHFDARSCAPIVFRADVESLFEGDSWFKGAEQANISVEEAGDSECEQHGEVPEQSVDDVALDMSGEQEFDEDDAEQHNSSDNELADTDVGCVMQSVTLVGLCRILAEQGLRSGGSREGRLPYRVAAFSALSTLLKSVEPNESSEQYNSIVEHQSYVYDAIAPSLFTFVSGGSSGEEKPAPVLVARALECLASAMYNEVGTGSEYNDSLVLLKLFSLSTGNTQPAWTVRQMAALAASCLIAKTSSHVVRRNDTIITVLECSSQALKDKKFWKVRAAGLELLLSLVSRVKQRGQHDPENQLIMEAILPYKEKIVGIARKSLSDNESQVTAAASKLTVAMNWWP